MRCKLSHGCCVTSIQCMGQIRGGYLETIAKWLRPANVRDSNRLQVFGLDAFHLLKIETRPSVGPGEVIVRRLGM